MSTAALQPSFHPHLLLPLAASFAAGVLLARVAAVPMPLWIALGITATLLAFLPLKSRRLRHATVLVTVAFACAGGALACAEAQGVAADRVRRLFEEGRLESGAPVEVTGVLTRAPEVAPGGLFIVLRAERVAFGGAEREAGGAVQLFAPVHEEATRREYGALELRRGARVRVAARLERAEEFRNPGGGSLTEYLERRELDATGVIKSPLLVERLDDERVLLPLVWLDAWREALRARLARTFTPEAAGVLQASLLGNRHGLSRAAAERFREGGTFHVLVISGLHISFIGGLALGLTRLVTRSRALQFAASSLLLWAYTLAVGAESSVVRAALMFTVVALAPLLARRGAALNALGFAALALLVWRPGNLFDPSFQLTFLSVLCIVALAWPLLERLRAVGGWRPTPETPYPPACPRPFLRLGETLYWSERAWLKELARNVYGYRLFKTPAAARLERWRVQRALRFTFAALAVSACVQAGMLPLLALYFHRVSAAALPLNVFVGLLMAASGLCALLALAASALSNTLAAPLVWLVEQLSWLMLHSVDPFARAGWASVRLPEYSGAAACVYALYFAPLLVLAFALARWQPLARPRSLNDDNSRTRRLLVRASCAALLLLAVIILAHPLSAAHEGNRLRVDFLDVGQGDAALVTLPGGATLLVDGGGRPRYGARAGGEDGGAEEPFEADTRGVGEAVVSEYLWRRGLDRVDYLLATHAHADHVEGLNDVARNFRVRAALVGRAPRGEESWERLAATLRERGVAVESIARGDSLRFGPVAMDVLWPPPAAGATGAVSGNDDSVVLRVRYGRRCLLLTGDIERRAEAALVAYRDGLRCDVVKVAHHGSRTSSTEQFVAAARPQVAVISVGAASPFGHPEPSVVARWRAHGAEVLQTGTQGTITVSTDGNDLKIGTYTGGELRYPD